MEPGEAFATYRINRTCIAVSRWRCIGIANRGIRYPVYASDNLHPLVNFWQHWIEDAEQLTQFVYDTYPLDPMFVKSLYPSKGQSWAEAKFTHIGDDFEKAGYFWILNKQSWCGKTLKSYGAATATIQPGYFIQDKWRMWKNPNIQVECMDWEQMLAKHHEKFLYLDPPYVEKEHYYGLQGHNPPFDHEGLAETLHTHGNGWLLSYGDHPLIRELYADCMIIKPTWFYGSSKELSSELLIISGLDISEDLISKLILTTSVTNSLQDPEGNGKQLDFLS